MTPEYQFVVNSGADITRLGVGVAKDRGMRCTKELHTLLVQGSAVDVDSSPATLALKSSVIFLIKRSSVRYRRTRAES